MNNILPWDYNPWILSKDGCSEGRALYERHYSCSPYRFAAGRRPKLFVGPGQKMVLLTPKNDALIVWRKFKDDCLIAPRDGVNMAVFRNESYFLSSSLIKFAVEYAWERWPNCVLYTYIKASAIKSTNPGFCYLQAGWVKSKERTKVNGLLLFTLTP